MLFLLQYLVFVIIFTPAFQLRSTTGQYRYRKCKFLFSLVVGMEFRRRRYFLVSLVSSQVETCDC